MCTHSSIAGGVEKGCFFQPLSFILWVVTLGHPFQVKKPVKECCSEPVLGLFNFKRNCAVGHGQV